MKSIEDDWELIVGAAERLWEIDEALEDQRMWSHDPEDHRRLGLLLGRVSVR